MFLGKIPDASSNLNLDSIALYLLPIAITDISNPTIFHRQNYVYIGHQNHNLKLADLNSPDLKLCLDPSMLRYQNESFHRIKFKLWPII